MFNDSPYDSLRDFLERSDIEYEIELSGKGKMVTATLPGAITAVFWFDTTGAYKDVSTHLNFEERHEWKYQDEHGDWHFAEYIDIEENNDG